MTLYFLAVFTGTMITKKVPAGEFETENHTEKCLKVLENINFDALTA